MSAASALLYCGQEVYRFRRLPGHVQPGEDHEVDPGRAGETTSKRLRVCIPMTMGKKTHNSDGQLIKKVYSRETQKQQMLKHCCIKDAAVSQTQSFSSHFYVLNLSSGLQERISRSL